MIEAHSIQIGPWLRSAEARDLSLDGPASFVRRLSDSVESPLGFAAWCRRGEGLLASWFGNRQITVYETEDASLLMTLRRGFWKIWDIFDSEEHLIGRLYRGLLLDHDGKVIAQPHRREQGIAFHDSLNQTLALFTPSGGNWTLSFGREVPTNPFVRLVLLGAALTHASEPK